MRLACSSCSPHRFEASPVVEKCRKVLKRGFTTNNVGEWLSLVGPHLVEVCKGYGTVGSLLSLAAQATIHCGDTWPQPWSGRQRIGRVAAAFTGVLGGRRRLA